MKAVPVLILEQWVRGEGKEGVANYVRSNTLARRIESSGLRTSFPSHGTSTVLGGLSLMQSARNLTYPPLLEYQREKGRVFWINLPHYEKLLQDYRRYYREHHAEDYKKLFPKSKDEPDWEQPSPQVEPVEQEGAKRSDFVSEEQDQIESALEHVRQVLLMLTEENSRLRELGSEFEKLVDKLAALKTPQHIIIDEELRADCAEFLERDDTYIDAIRRAGVVLEERIRETIGGSGQERFKAGVDLVDYALRPGSGMLVISEHPAEQEGVRMLFRGAVQFVRNPPSHKKLKYTELESRQVISLIDYLLSLLGQARLREM